MDLFSHVRALTDSHKEAINRVLQVGTEKLQQKRRRRTEMPVDGALESRERLNPDPMENTNRPRSLTRRRRTVLKPIIPAHPQPSAQLTRCLPSVGSLQPSADEEANGRRDGYPRAWTTSSELGAPARRPPAEGDALRRDAVYPA